MTTGRCVTTSNQKKRSASRASKHWTRFARCGCASLTLLFSEPALAQRTDSDLTASLGGTQWSGDFGASTNSLVTSGLLGVRYRLGGLRLTANIPYMRIRSDGTIYTGINGTPIFVSPTTSPANKVRKGIGDLTLGGSYLLPDSAGLGFDLELIGRVKIPTASKSSSLSTGKADYAGGFSAAKTIGRITPSVSATYRVFGDTPTWNFRDGFEVTAGASYAVTDRTVVLISYDYAQAATPLIEDLHEVVAGVSTPLVEKLRLTAFAGAGLSNGAAGFSGGASLGFKF